MSIVDYIGFGLLLIFITVYQISISFSTVLTLEGTFWESNFYFLFAFLIVVLSWWSNRNRPGTYQQEYRR